MARQAGDLKGDARDRWYQRSTAEIEEEKARAFEAGRKVWASGERALARTESELEALRRTELARQAMEGGAQVGAVARATANRVTLGRADDLSAAGDALLGFGAGHDFGERYRSNLQQEHGRTRYDAVNRPVAKATGDLVAEALVFKGAGKAGAYGSSRLPPKAKGVLGEVLSAGKTILRGDRPVALQVQHPLVTGGRTVIDHVTRAGKFVEAKFGPTARLSQRQRQAQALYGDSYRVDRWQPYHVGRITGGAGAGAAWLYDDDDVR